MSDQKTVWVKKLEGSFSHPGDFCVVLNENESEILVPEDIFNWCNASSVRTLEEFFSLLQQFSGTFCNVFDWTREQFDKALSDLRELLRQKKLVPAELLSARSSFQRGFGARSSRSLKRPDTGTIIRE